MAISCPCCLECGMKLCYLRDSVGQNVLMLDKPEYPSDIKFLNILIHC